MRIVIDMQGAQSESRSRGIGRYSLALALAIARNAQQHEVWLVLNGALGVTIEGIREAFTGLVPRERIRVVDIVSPCAEVDPRNSPRARASELLREYFIAQIAPDAVLVTSLFEGYIDDAVVSVGRFLPGVTTAVILYDLIPLLNPATYLGTEVQRRYYDRKLASLRRAGLLLAISDYSREEALDALNLAPERVVSISTAVDTSFAPAPVDEAELATLRTRFGLRSDFLMYAPGGFDSRKNIDGLITAFSGLPADLRKRYQLLIASKVSDAQRLEMEQHAQRCGLAPGEVILTGYIDDATLIALYRTCALFVFPSKHEGFGLPALEAMSCGAPVIGASTTSVPEVIGCDEALFDPHDPAAIGTRIAQVLRDPAMLARLRAHGRTQAASFSWDASARRALRALEQHREALAVPIGHAINGTSRAELYPRLLDTEGIDFDDALLYQCARSMARAHDPLAPRQLLVDVTAISQHDLKTGIERVVRTQLRELLQLSDSSLRVEAVYFQHEDGALRCRYARRYAASLLGIDVNPSGNDDLVDVMAGDIYYSGDHSPHIAITAAREGLFAHWRMRGVEINFVLYDLLPVLRPEFFPPGADLTQRAWLACIAAQAHRVIGISDAVAQELRAWLAATAPGQRQPVITSLHLGADIACQMAACSPQGEHLRQIASRPSFLMVGTIEPRKGHLQALDAFDRLWQAGIDVNLVVVGNEGWTALADAERRTIPRIVERLRTHPELGRRLWWLSGIDDTELEQVYSASSCLLAPSEGEGFGLPLIEAARHGLSILARDLPVFREVGGDGVDYFSGLDGASLADALQDWLARRAAGTLAQVSTLRWMSWQENVRRLLDVLKTPAYRSTPPVHKNA